MKNFHTRTLIQLTIKWRLAEAEATRKTTLENLARAADRFDHMQAYSERYHDLIDFSNEGLKQ